MSKMKLAIIGAGALGRQIAWQAECSDKFEIAGFFDDFAVGEPKVVGKTSAIRQFYSTGLFDVLAVGVGYKAMMFRQAIFAEYRNEIPFADIVHERAVVDPSATTGGGCVMLPNAVLDQNVRLNGNCFMSIAVTISHDTQVGAGTYCSPRSTVCGNCRIGERVFLGAGCIIRDGIRICDDAVIGAGAVVVRDIDRPGVYVGNPARFLKELE